MDSGPLFLLGGSEGNILDAVAEPFIRMAGGRGAVIALLLIGGNGWESHLPEYVDPWMKNGATEYHVIIPKDDGLLDINASIEQLRKASGIFIGGGQTSRYLELYASEPIRSIIQERVNAGVPFAGMSAGARMASRRCCLFPTPKAPEQAFTMAQGLGLVNDLIVEVHFDENPKGLEYLLEGMSRTQIPRGLGIGAASCAVLRNGRLEYALGDCVSEVTMTDFETRSYEIV